MIGFCVRNSYSFATIPSSRLYHHVALCQPQIVIAHTTDILQLVNKMKKGLAEVRRGEGNVLDREDITELEFSFSGLLGDEGRLQSNILKSVRNAVKVSARKAKLFGVVSVGHPPPREFQSDHIQYFYHITPSDDLLGPLECVDITRKL